jgi:ribonuclease VapC
MVLDSSALVSVVLAEPAHRAVLSEMLAAPVLLVGAPTLAETALVLSVRLDRDARPLLNEILREMDVEVVAFDRTHYDVAVDAFRRFGKGRHRAGLNFGDCLTYAVARVAGLSLLYTGNDFSQTELAARNSK